MALQDTFKSSGWDSSGPASGWYPFWSAAALGAAGLMVMVDSVRTPAQGGVFTSAQGAMDFSRVALPMVAVAASIPWLGFYIASGLYIGGFARWQGRYPWVAVGALALGIPLTLYLSFELGFRVPLPKSLFYQQGILLF